MTTHDILQKYYGYHTFRPGQEPLVDAVLAGRDALGVMPTGAGKSVCFQVPSLLLPGITLVISPLVSLMRDQVTQLVQMGVPAAFLNSSLTFHQYRLALERAKEGRYKIIYVSPERLETPGFRDFALSADISMVAVDEAHCISQWGQDFRPAYLNIPQFITDLPRRPVVSAFTATATPDVRTDIQRVLQLQDPLAITTGFNRENLYFEVQEPTSKKAALLSIIRNHPDSCGIVYCSTRKNVEMVCESLQNAEITATRYHAGLEPQERRANQEDFRYDRASVMVATNAFGMGIDKSDVRYVVHYNMPKDMESYYQEAGRAGRDGAPADCILLYSGQDVRTNEFLITHSRENSELDPQTARALEERDLHRLRLMTAYTHTTGCLRQYILQYFGETAPDCCDNCYNCKSVFSLVDVRQDAEQILRCVAETGQSFGAGVVTAVLRGADNERIRRYHLDEKASYGALKHLSSSEMTDRIRFLIQRGTLVLTEGKFPVLRLGTVPLGDGTLSMKVDTTRKDKGSTKPSKAKLVASLDVRQAALFERLKALRKSIAALQGVPAFVVFSDSTLLEMAVEEPRSMAEFRSISGIGAKKAEQYGDRFLQQIATFVREH